MHRIKSGSGPIMDFRAYEATPGISVVVLPDPPVYTHVAVSNDFIRATGMRREDVIGKGHFEIFPKSANDPDFTGEQNLKASFDFILRNKIPHEIPEQRYDIPNADGTFQRKFWRIVNVPILDDARNVIYIVHSAFDLTDRMEAQQKAESIEETQRKWQQLANSMPAIVWAGYADGRIHFLNDQWYEFTGLSRASSLDFGWMEALHPEDVERCLNIWNHAKHKETSYETELRYRTKKGGYRWLLSRGVPIKEHGKIIAWYGTSTDIHEQKGVESLLEERVKERTRALQNQKNLLDSILKNSSNGISVTEMIRDKEGHVVDAITLIANDAAVKFTGLPRDVYLSKKASELDPNILTSPYGQTCLKTLTTGEPSIIQYFLEITGRWLELTISKMDDDHLIHIFTDVTPIKEAQLQLERSVEDLKYSNASLEEFAYAASHDMKEPVRKIQVFSNRLKEDLEGKLTESQNQLFQRLENASKRMGALIDALLTYSHTTKGTAEFEDVDLKAIINDVLEDLDLEVEQKAARLKINNLPRIKGDRLQIQQLFQNLVSNALKYNHPGKVPEIVIASKLVKGKEVKSNLMPDEAEKKFHLIEVCDNGIGFDQRDADKIFNVFTRLHNNAQYTGTGVGLSIVRKVVENHKGFVWAESEPGKGSKFKILLPS